ncbi:MAG: hypothetical protein EPN93_14020 [Spirochaetes bacterium]|nr:MAG: hypothetical protein EPN93_14020 [Spirochaetota bacterium]
MKIEDAPFTITDWSVTPSSTLRGTRGLAASRVLERGNARLRMIEYSAGYVADHWCARGHAALVLDGDILVEIENGGSFALTAGMSFLVADGRDAHRVSSHNGARVFIVD